MPARDNLQFDRAEPSGGQPALSCAACGNPITTTYFEANGKVVCESCRRALEADWNRGGSAGRFGKALALGVLAMIGCAIVWYLVLKWTDSQWGILAIVVGLVVGGAVRKGSNHRGGWRYQTLAILLTYTAIVSSYVPFVLEGIRERANQPAQQPADSADVAAVAPVATRDTLAAPDSTAAMAAAMEQLGPIGLVIGLIILVAVLYAAPFLTALEAPIGLLIIGFALYEAWQLNKRVELKITGPYQVGARA